MIKEIKIDYDLDVFLKADYSVHKGSCISYQVVEQNDIHKTFGGFPNSYTENNTKIQQLWFTKDVLDFDSIGNQLDMEVVTISSILQPPGNVITMHRDTFFKINQLYPNDKRKKVRARNKQGQYIGDDKSTPDVNEAYTEVRAKKSTKK